MVSAAYAANKILDDLSIVSIADLQQLDLIAFERGAIVQYRTLSGAEARLITLGAKAIITISTSIENHRRQRFSIGHELGHLEMHRRQQGVFFCTAEDLDNWQATQIESRLEYEANEFSASLLLPERFFVQQSVDTDPSWEVIEELAGVFDVSLTATALRYVRFCEVPCAFVFVQQDRVKWFRASRSFHELGAFIDVRARVDPGTLTGRYLNNGRARRCPSRVSVSAWLPDWRTGHGITMLEQVRPAAGLDAVLVLIWFDDDDVGDLY